MSTTPRLSPFDAVYSALLGTLLTWAVTAAGAGVVYLALPSKRLLDTALGFAAGVMLAASYWSLLAPALEMADASGDYGEVGRWKMGEREGEERTEEKKKRKEGCGQTFSLFFAVTMARWNAGGWAREREGQTEEKKK